MPFANLADSGAIIHDGKVSYKGLDPATASPKDCEAALKIIYRVLTHNTGTMDHDHEVTVHSDNFGMMFDIKSHEPKSDGYYLGIIASYLPVGPNRELRTAGISANTADIATMINDCAQDILKNDRRYPPRTNQLYTIGLIQSAGQTR